MANVVESNIAVQTSANGVGVFAVKPIGKGELVCNFEGPLLQLKDMPTPYQAVEDHYVQVGQGLYMGPSGKIDDYFNHSCEPNSGLVIEGVRAHLRAIKDIAPGEEVTWDYSTTMDEDDWELNCLCGRPNCRNKIQDFKHLPPALRAHYVTLGIVPAYNLKYV